MIESEADRRAMLVSLGQTVAGPRGEFPAIFENEFLDVDGVEQTVPVLNATAVDTAGLRKGAPIVIDGETYLVRRVEPDGTGMVRVVLEQ